MVTTAGLAEEDCDAVLRPLELMESNLTDDSEPTGKTG